MTDLNQPMVRRTYRSQVVFVLSWAAALYLAWVTVAAAARGVWGILRFVIPGGVQ